MRLMRYAGVMLAAGLLWVVVSALLRTMGLGQRATVVVGFLILFILWPVLMALASGTKESSGGSASPNGLPPTESKGQ